MRVGLFILFMLCHWSLYGQQVNNCYLGNKARLSFATATPTILTNGQTDILEGCATISDAGGPFVLQGCHERLEPESPKV
jgi:hypothetical protein